MSYLQLQPFKSHVSSWQLGPGELWPRLSHHLAARVGFAETTALGQNSGRSNLDASVLSPAGLGRSANLSHSKLETEDPTFFPEKGNNDVKSVLLVNVDEFIIFSSSRLSKLICG